MRETRLASRAERWALALTERQSVTGTEGEAGFGPWLAEELRRDAILGDAKIWTIPVASGDPRQCVAMLLRGTGRQTVILTGHYDTVSIDDYGDLRHLATKPAALASALRDRLAGKSGSAVAGRVREELASGEFLPGRGLLDMKAGLAAGLAVCTAYAEQADRPGSLLFIAVPDEENNSAGARRAAQDLPEISNERDLELVAAINLDAIADNGDGSHGRVIALGTIGKLLPTAYVVGVPAHSGFPFNGLNAAGLAAAIAARVEWASELTDGSASRPGTPPSLLSIHDGKAAYDVTTPSSAFATFNVLSFKRTPAEVLERFDRICAEAASRHLADMRQRAIHSARPDNPFDQVSDVPIYRYEAVETTAIEFKGENEDQLRNAAETLARLALPLPERCRRMTELAWELSGLPAPAIVTGFASIPYLPTSLSTTRTAERLESVARTLAGEATRRYGTAVSCTDYFSGISDMSFFGEAAERDLDVVARNTPTWKDSVHWPEQNGLGNIPTINIGPWGRDYHTPLERLHVGYAFDVLPELIGDLIESLLNDRDERLDPAAPEPEISR